MTFHLVPRHLTLDDLERSNRHFCDKFEGNLHNCKKKIAHDLITNSLKLRYVHHPCICAYNQGRFEENWSSQFVTTVADT